MQDLTRVYRPDPKRQMRPPGWWVRMFGPADTDVQLSTYADVKGGTQATKYQLVLRPLPSVPVVAPTYAQLTPDDGTLSPYRGILFLPDVLPQRG